MIKFYLLFTILCSLFFSSAEVVIEKLPCLNINIDEIDSNQDIFFIEIETNEDFNKWLNNTNYMTTHYSLIYLYNSGDDNEFANVHDYVSTELRSFSRNMLDTRHNIINRNCYETNGLDDLDNEYEFEDLNVGEIRETGLFFIDNILQCQENIKSLTFIVDLKNIELNDIEILSDSKNRLIIFPPTINLHDYHKQKYQIQSSMFWDDNGINDEDNLSLLLEELDYDETNEQTQVTVEKQLSGAELFEKFVNESKFSILGSEYVDEVVFYEYEDLHLNNILDNFNDWRFKLWDYLARTLVIYINIPSSMQEQTNIFLYYFAIFFAILIVLKKKVLPYITKKENDNSETSEEDSKSGKQILFMLILFSFMIIISSITGYQFVKLNSIVLLVRDEKTNDLVYFAGTFNWQFGIESVIISVIYIILVYMMLLILKKSREMDTVEERKDETKYEILLNLLSMLIVLYLIKFVSHDMLTMKIFKSIKYYNSYAY